jgi:hypothetical protein
MATLDANMPPGTDPNGPANVSPTFSPTSSSSSFPDPISTPTEFTTYLLSLANPDLVGTWEHLRQRPMPIPGTNRLEDGVVSDWSNRMDLMVVSLF